MVVCKFFLNGSCKFGKYCKNEHPTQSEQDSLKWEHDSLKTQKNYQNSFKKETQKWNYSNKEINTQNNLKWNNRRTETENNNSQTTLEEKIYNELTKEKPLWYLSVYNPSDKMIPALYNIWIGDISPEEVRLDAYNELFFGGNINKHVSAFIELKAEVERKMKLVLSDLTTVKQIIENRQLFGVPCWKKEEETMQSHTKEQQKEFDSITFTYGKIPETPPNID